mmetsp:Transcript_95551/g.270137  ORF Transcript_95551/g.270137 Transcript_95551/m.270137 type:complete len:214 (+) Transcript_95551:321-962(+)
MAGPRPLPLTAVQRGQRQLLLQLLHPKNDLRAIRALEVLPAARGPLLGTSPRSWHPPSGLWGACSAGSTGASPCRGALGRRSPRCSAGSGRALAWPRQGRACCSRRARRNSRSARRTRFGHSPPLGLKRSSQIYCKRAPSADARAVRLTATSTRCLVPTLASEESQQSQNPGSVPLFFIRRHLRFLRRRSGRARPCLGLCRTPATSLLRVVPA